MGKKQCQIFNCITLLVLHATYWLVSSGLSEQPFAGVNVLPRSEAQLLASRKVQRSKDRPTKPIQSNK